MNQDRRIKALEPAEIAAATAELRQLRLHLHLCMVADALERAGRAVTIAGLAQYVDPEQALTLPAYGASELAAEADSYLVYAVPPRELAKVAGALRRLADDPEVVWRFERAVAEGRDAYGPLAGVLADLLPAADGRAGTADTS